MFSNIDLIHESEHHLHMCQMASDPLSSLPKIKLNHHIASGHHEKTLEEFSPRDSKKKKNKDEGFHFESVEFSNYYNQKLSQTALDFSNFNHVKVCYFFGII